LLWTLLPSIPRFTWTAAVDILVVAVIIYQFIMIVRGRRSAHIIGGIGVVVLTYGIAVLANMELLRSILATLAPYTAFGLIVMFQSELRRMLARIGRRGWFTFGSRWERRELSDEILLALELLSQHKTGALIVLEYDIGLRTFTESGIHLDAIVSRDLLLSIFQPGGSMHDGAAIVQGNRVVAAACFLPLTMNPVMVGKLGTRHRAAIGITEETDCLALIVSEETGRISIAAFGDVERDVSLEKATARMAGHGREVRIEKEQRRQAATAASAAQEKESA